MSWKKQSVVEQRQEFVELAQGEALSMAELCRRFGISRKTGYKWRRRFAVAGVPGLLDQRQRAVRRSNQTGRRMEKQVIRLRQSQPTWGPRKLHRRLQNCGHHELPAVSTVARILKRAGLIAPEASRAHTPVQRFERAEPNQLWQMDFKGHFALHDQGRCHPFTMLDDCSRYLLALHACGDERTATVQSCLRRSFRLHGLPEGILCDNGAPWGGCGHDHTQLTVWLLRLGIAVYHGRPHHPQTQGKEERFHRTLKADLLARHDWRDLAQAQRRFDRYRRLYNHDRPHEALALAVPATRYRPSSRVLPSLLPPIAYDTGETLRTVKAKGEITFQNRFFHVGRAFAGLPVALRPTASDGLYRVCFTAFTLGIANLSLPNDRPKGHCFPLLPPLEKCHP